MPATFPPRSPPKCATGTLTDVGENLDDWKYQGRHTHFAVGAAKKAVADSGLDLGRIDPTRFGIYTGSGEGQQDFDRFSKMMVAGSARREPGLARFTKAGLGNVAPAGQLEQEPNMPAVIWRACSTPRGRTSTA